MAATKAITTIHTAEIQYYSQYGQHAATLAQLGPPVSGAPGPNAADLIDRDLATGERRGFKFVLQSRPTGYILLVSPTAFGTSGTRTYYSDQSMAIHVHRGKEPATANDALLGETFLAKSRAGLSSVRKNRVHQVQLRIPTCPTKCKVPPNYGQRHRVGAGLAKLLRPRPIDTIEGINQPQRVEVGPTQIELIPVNR